ncbi:reverse transcriptase domain-containing protein [Tanacetum coccineum]
MRRVSRRSSDHHSSPDFTSESSSSGSSSDSSSDTFSGSPSDSLSDTSSVHSSGFDASGQSHSGPSTRVASSRSLDSSSLSVRLSHKRCKSPTTSVPSSTHVSRLITSTHVDLLPPHKRFRDSYSPEDSREEHMEIGTADAEAVADLGTGDGVGAHTEDGIGMGVEIAAIDIKEDEEEFKPETSAGGTMEIAVDPLVIGVHYMSEVPIDRITEFETAQRQLEAGQLMASGERAGLTDRIRRLGRENLRVRALLCIERDRVDSLCHHMALSQEEFCQIRRDRDDARRRRRRLESFDMTITRSGMTPEEIEELIAQRVAEALANYEATRAANALKAKSQSENGNDGDNGNGGNRNGGNGNGNHRDGRKTEMEIQIRMVEIQKMETELWNLTVKNNDLAAYTQRFQELTPLCTRMVPEEEERIERYVGGLPDNIQGNVMSAEPTRLHDAIRLANNLMDQKLKGYAIRSAENKRNFESNQRDNRAQQPPFKRQNVGGSNVARAYTAGGNKVMVFVGPRPLCNKCKLHHVRPCTVKCRSCGKIGHLTRDWHFKKDCSKLKNRNHGNQLVIPEARGKAYAIGGGDANPGSNVVTTTFLLNNHYASVLFDLGAD